MACSRVIFTLCMYVCDLCTILHMRTTNVLSAIAINSTAKRILMNTVLIFCILQKTLQEQELFFRAVSPQLGSLRRGDTRYNDTATGLTSQKSGFDSQQGNIYLPSIASRPTLEAHPGYYSVGDILSPGVTRPKREEDH